MYSIFQKTSLWSLKNTIQKEAGYIHRFFSKIYNFKTTYPVLYEHVHPDSRHLFDKDFVESSSIVKWMCPEGPDHIWESDIASRVRSYKRRNHCFD